MVGLDPIHLRIIDLRSPSSLFFLNPNRQLELELKSKIQLEPDTTWYSTIHDPENNRPDEYPRPTHLFIFLSGASTRKHGQEKSRRPGP
jgi:hypothetical protein